MFSMQTKGDRERKKESDRDRPEQHHNSVRCDQDTFHPFHSIFIDESVSETRIPPLAMETKKQQHVLTNNLYRQNPQN